MPTENAIIVAAVVLVFVVFGVVLAHVDRIAARRPSDGHPAE